MCRVCGHHWSESSDDKSTFADARISEREPVVFQAFALVAMGLPLAQIQGLVNRKSETIQSWLLRSFAVPAIWQRVENNLISDHGIHISEVEGLRALLKGISSRKSTFHTQSRRRLAIQIKGERRFGKQHRSFSEQQFCEFARTSAIPEGKIKILWRQYQHSADPAVSKTMETVRTRLKERIEDVLQCQIAVTPTGDFHRSENDKRVERWLAEVLRFNTANNEAFLRSLSPLEEMVFGQVRRPNEVAHFYAKLEGARGLKRGRPWPEKMTPECLAKGLGLELGFFISVLKSVSQILTRRA